MTARRFTAPARHSTTTTAGRSIGTCIRSEMSRTRGLNETGRRSSAKESTAGSSHWIGSGFGQSTAPVWADGSPTVAYRATLSAISRTSASGNGGSQRLRFSTIKAASIDSRANPRRRIVPASDTSPLLRSPGAHFSPSAKGAARSRVRGFASLSSSHSGASARERRSVIPLRPSNE